MPAENESKATASLSCSVIIPVCRGGTNFVKCFSSAMAAIQKHDGMNGVGDGEGGGSWRTDQEMGVRVVKLPANSGPARARNAGAETSKADILFFVDADVIIPSDSVERIQSIFETEKDLA